MNWDDFVYATLLILSVPFGLLVKKTSDYTTKQIYSSAAGVVLVAVVCGWDGLHSLITALVNACIVHFLSPKKCHLVSFLWCFGYIAFFRTTHFFGLPKVIPHANAVQLLLTLKLVGVAYEVHDDHMNKEALKKEENEELRLKAKYQEVKPSFMDMMHYSYCYIGLLTGPYYKYRTYHDMLTNKTSEHRDILKSLGDLVYWIPAVAITFLVLSHFYYIEYVRSDEFYENPFWYRLWFMTPMFFVFKVRMYFAWLMSEVVCIIPGLGAYPKESKPRCGAGPMDLKALDESLKQDPEKVEVNFATVHNINMWGCEFSTTLRDAMKCWNMSVQYWLAQHVYRRVNNKQWRTTVTMLVSAFWHGIHPGYYLSFLTVPPIVMAESALEKTFCKGRPESQQKIYVIFGKFMTARFLEYMSMGFLILGGWQTMRYWSSIYFCCHVVIVIFFILSNVFKPYRPKDVDDSSTSSSTKESLKKD